ncbi:hypothetical protein IMAU10418_02666 [Lactiplantibacillus plantarum]|nr:hypothetical protein [Lactiplantibacillus plantarum]
MLLLKKHSCGNLWIRSAKGLPMHAKQWTKPFMLLLVWDLKLVKVVNSGTTMLLSKKKQWTKPKLTLMSIKTKSLIQAIQSVKRLVA